MLNYILIAVGILVALWLIAAVRKISSAVKSGEFQQALEAKRTLRELNQDTELSPGGAQQFMNEYVAEHSAKVSTPIDDTPDKPEINARFSWWLAVRSDSTDVVVAALDASNVTTCNWVTASETISSSMSNQTFAGSPIDGWVLLFGLLPEPDNESPELGLWGFLTSLSDTFGAAQYFSCSTVADFYSWAKAENGRMVRAFSVSGDTVVWNHGVLTPEEANAGFNVETGQTGSASTLAKAEAMYNVDNPLTMAHDWSVSPEDLYGRDDLALGVGKLFTLTSVRLRDRTIS